LDILQDTCDFSDQDWISIFEKDWIRTESGYWFDFYNKIFLRVIQDVTNDGGRGHQVIIIEIRKSEIRKG